MKLGIRCLARRVLKNFLEDCLRYSVTYTKYVKRKTGTMVDVVAVLKRQGRVKWCYKLPRSVSSASKRSQQGCEMLAWEAWSVWGRLVAVTVEGRKMESEEWDGEGSVVEEGRRLWRPWCQRQRPI